MNSAKQLLLLLTVLFMHLPSMAQTVPIYQKENYVSKTDTLPYRILYPKNYDATKTYPLLVFLHGSGERGNDNEAQLGHGSYLFLKENIREEFPAFVVFPQCPTNLSWNNLSTSMSGNERIFHFPATLEENGTLDLLEGLMEDLQKSFSINSQRIYLGGLSMGGMGTFEMLHRNPQLFAAAFAICGGANPDISERIKHIPIWIFHGEEDKVVPVKYSQQMHDTLEKVGGKSRLTLYPDVKHDSWTPAFEEPDLLPWLFSKSL